MTNQPQKGHGHGYMTHFKYGAPNDIQGMAEAESSNVISS